MEEAPESGQVQREAQREPSSSSSEQEVEYRFHRINGVWSTIRQTNKPPLIECVMKIIRDPKQFDMLVLSKGNVMMKVQSIVCKAYSGYFRKLKNVKFVELPQDVKPATFIMMYQWLVDDDPQLSMENIVELYKVAIILEVQALQEHCMACFSNKEVIRENTAFEIFLRACESEMPVIAMNMVDRITRYFMNVVASKAYLKLQVYEVKLFLNSNVIGVNTEVEVLFAAVRWLNYEFEQRKPFIQEVMSCVRFALIPPWYLLTIDRDELPLEMERALRNKDVKKMLTIALSYVVMKNHYKDDPIKFGKCLKLNNLSKPQNRVWVLDASCSYHLGLGHNATQYPSYELFLSHLVGVRSFGDKHWKTVNYASSDHEDYLYNIRPNIKNPSVAFLEYD